MKKNILLFTCTAAIIYFTLSSESNGPANNSHNCTGSNGTATTCSGSGCHGSGAGPTVSLTVLYNGTPVTKHKPGLTYIVRIHGSGTANPKYGFQFCAVKSTGTPQVDAGKFGSPPGGMHAAPYPVTAPNNYFMEHSLPLTPATVGTYDTAFSWTDTTRSGDGNVTMYGTLLTVNGNDTADAADVSGNASITLAEAVGVTKLSEAIGIKTYPNPIGNDLRIQISNADAGNYTFHIFDITGRYIMSQNAVITGSNYETTIHTTNWPKGFYFLQIVKDDAQRCVRLVKE